MDRRRCGRFWRRHLPQLLPLLPLLLAGCATTPADPKLQACQQGLENLSRRLMPAFERLGYRPEVRIQLDADLANGRGFPALPEVQGDSMPGGRVRLRPALCADAEMAGIVLAHEMSHVALHHHGTLSTGVNLAWETPRNELEADGLARKVLQQTGARQEVVDFLACRLGQCGPIPGFKHKPVGSNKEMEER